MKIIVMALAGATTLVLTGCTSQSAQPVIKIVPTTFTFSGDISVSENITSHPDANTTVVQGIPTGDLCTSSDGYDDISYGAEVTLYGANGNVIGTSTLQEGRSVSAESILCKFDISISDVPNNEKFYQLTIGHRNKVTFTNEEATTGDVHLTLG